MELEFFIYILSVVSVFSIVYCISSYFKIKTMINKFYNEYKTYNIGTITKFKDFISTKSFFIRESDKVKLDEIFILILK